MIARAAGLVAFIAALAACPGGGGGVPADDKEPSVTNAEMKEWLVRAERAHGGDQATGEARVTAAMEPGDGSPASLLAAARAWHALGTRASDGSDWDGALACARAGISELGDAYRARGVKDDTGLQLHLVEEQFAKGEADKAARTALGVLETRAALLARGHELR